MSKPLTVNTPFPQTDCICPDALSLKIISPAYASPTGELNAILQYTYHSIYFAGAGFKDIAEALEGIAVAEMYHFRLLGKTVLALGASPVFTQYPPSSFGFYSAKYVAYSRSLENMLEDDILSERRAVAAYSKMLRCLKNEQVTQIVSRIKEDEELHLKTLQSLLCSFKG